MGDKAGVGRAVPGLFTTSVVNATALLLSEDSCLGYRIMNTSDLGTGALIAGPGAKAPGDMGLFLSGPGWGRARLGGEAACLAEISCPRIPPPVCNGI